jgi:uncharacterized protein (TIGR03083 family)
MHNPTYTDAARAFAQLVRDIPADRWDGPGLGEWDLRALVGHASRSLVTVITYMDVAAEREDIATAAEYYARATAFASSMGASAVVERGRQAGRELGADPAAAVDKLVDEVVRKLADADDRLIQVIGGLGIRLATYLPTRIFELAVHSLDIAAAVDIPVTLPANVLTEATVLAAQIGVAMGEGATVLMALTGRAALPPGFSVV